MALNTIKKQLLLLGMSFTLFGMSGCDKAEELVKTGSEKIAQKLDDNKSDKEDSDEEADESEETENNDEQNIKPEETENRDEQNSKPEETENSDEKNDSDKDSGKDSDKEVIESFGEYRDVKADLKDDIITVSYKKSDNTSKKVTDISISKISREANSCLVYDVIGTYGKYAYIKVGDSHPQGAIIYFTGYLIQVALDNGDVNWCTDKTTFTGMSVKDQYICLQDIDDECNIFTLDKSKGIVGNSIYNTPSGTINQGYFYCGVLDYTEGLHRINLENGKVTELDSKYARISDNYKYDTYPESGIEIKGNKVYYEIRKINPDMCMMGVPVVEDSIYCYYDLTEMKNYEYKHE